MKSVLVLVPGLIAATAQLAHADPPGMTPPIAVTDDDNDPDIDPRIVAAGSDTSRVMVGAGLVNFASYPNGIVDPAPTFVVSKPLWLGERRAHFQWALDATLLAGFGTYSHHAQLAALPGFGFDLYWGPRVGIEVRGGPAGFAQVGKRSVVGLGMGGSGAFVIRPLKDDRQRIKLWALMSLGYPLADDSMNDFIGSGAFGVGIGYETPY